MRNTGMYKVKYSGLNFTNFLNFAVKNNIAISNIDRINNKEVLFSIDSVSYKRLKKIKNPYKLKPYKSGGIKFLINTFLNRIGVAIGLFILIIMQILFGNRIMYVNVLGSTNSGEIRNLVLKYSKEYDNINKINIEELQNYILDNVENLSLVSIKTAGNAIVVNVVENHEKDVVFENFYAPYNMVIKEVELISGTLCVGKDSVVKKGNILVEPYIINSNGERINVEAKAKIIADVWFCGSETVNKNIISYIKTGNKKVFSELVYNNNKTTDIVSPYRDYVTESYNINITNKYFLPLTLYKTVFYETQKNVEKFDFKKNKNELLEKSKKKAYDILPNNVIINEVVQNISELEDRYVFQTYLKSTMEITNES